MTIEIGEVRRAGGADRSMLVAPRYANYFSGFARRDPNFSLTQDATRGDIWRVCAGTMFGDISGDMAT